MHRMPHMLERQGRVSEADLEEELEPEVEEPLNEYGMPAVGRPPGRRSRLAALLDSTPNLPRRLAAARASSGAAIPAPVRRELEDALGVSLDGVTVHRGGVSDEAVRAVGALAFTIGQQIHLGAGVPDDGPAARAILAHEAAHTVQQRGAGEALAPALGARGDRLESEAHAFAHAFAAPAFAAPAFAAGTGRHAPIRPAPGAVSRPTVMCIYPDDDVPPELAAGRDYDLQGTREAPLLVLRRSWLTAPEQHVARGFEGEIDETLSPTVIAPLATLLRSFFTTLTDEQIRPMLGLTIFPGQWEQEIIGVPVRNELLARLTIMDSPGLVQMILPVDGGFSVHIDTDRAYTTDPPAADERRGVIETTVAAIEEQVGATMLASERRALITRWLELLPATRAGIVTLPSANRAVLDQVFGEAVVTAWEAASAPIAEDETVIDVAGGGLAVSDELPAADRRRLAALLRQIFGAAPARPPEDAPPEDARRLSVQELDRLFLLVEMPEARRASIVAELHAMMSADPTTTAIGTAPRDVDLINAIAVAEAEVDRRADADRLGITLDDVRSPLATDDPGEAPLVARPVAGHISGPTDVNVGMNGEYHVEIVDRDPTLLMPGYVNVRWAVGWVDGRTHEITGRTDDSFAVNYRDDPATRPDTYTPTFRGEYPHRVVAFVHHTHYMPARFTLDVRVIDAEDRVDDLEEAAEAGWGTEDRHSRRTHHFDVATLDPAHALGEISEGELREEMMADGWVTGEREVARLDEEIASLEAVVDLYGSDAELGEMLTDRLTRLRGLRLETEGVSSGAATQVEAEAFFASSSTASSASAQLPILVSFTIEEGVHHGTLRDHAELTGEPITVTAEGASYDAMMVALFLEHADHYPPGILSFRYQQFEGTEPTSRYTRLSRVTNNLHRDLMRAAESTAVTVAIGVVGALMLFFPPAAGVTFGIAAFAFSAATTFDQFEEQYSSGRLEAHEVVLGLGALMLDLIPIGGRIMELRRVGGRMMAVARVSSTVAGIGGDAADAWMVRQDYVTRLTELHDGAITELARMHGERDELQRTDPTNPRIGQLDREIAALVTEIRAQSEALIEEMLREQAVLRVPLGLLHSAAEGAADHLGLHAADGDDATATTPRRTTGATETETTTTTTAPETDADGAPRRATGPADGVPDMFDEAARRAAGRAATLPSLASPLPFETLTDANREVLRRETGAHAIVLDPGLGRNVEAHPTVGLTGVTVTLHVGPHAIVPDIVRHRAAAAMVARYAGVFGGFRFIWERLTARFGELEPGANPFPPGTRAHRGFAEIPKLQDIIAHRRELLGERLAPGYEGVIAADLTTLEADLARHRRAVEEIDLTEGTDHVGVTFSSAVDRTRQARRAGYPAIDTALYRYVEDPDGVLPYRIVRNPLAPEGTPELSVIRRAGRLVTREGTPTIAEMSETITGGWPARALAHFERLEDAFIQDGAHVVAARDLAVTGTTIGANNPDFETRLAGLIWESLSRRGEHTAAEMIEIASRLAHRVATHEIVVVRGSGMLRVFDYEGHYIEGSAEDPEGQLHHLIPLYLGGDSSLGNLLDLDADLHRRVHELLEGARFTGETLLAPHSIQNARGLRFQRGAAVIFPDGTMQLYQITTAGARPVGAERIPAEHHDD